MCFFAVWVSDGKGWTTLGLNPYCSGCASLPGQIQEIDIVSKGLNPYCSGCASLPGIVTAHSVKQLLS